MRPSGTTNADKGKAARPATLNLGRRSTLIVGGGMQESVARATAFRQGERQKAINVIRSVPQIALLVAATVFGLGGFLTILAGPLDGLHRLMVLGVDMGMLSMFLTASWHLSSGDRSQPPGRSKHLAAGDHSQARKLLGV
jgi:hypothetical protein